MRLKPYFQLYQAAFKGHPAEIWTLGLVTVMNRMGTMVLPFLAVYLTTELDFSYTDAGILSGTFGAGSLAGTYLAGRLTDRIGFKPVIFVSLSVSGMLLISLQFFTAFEQLLPMFFITALFGEAYRPAMGAAVGAVVDAEQTGRSMALLRLAVNLGLTAAPTLGGFMIVQLGYEWLFWVDGSSCILAAFFFLCRARFWQKFQISPVSTAGQSDLEQAEAALALPPYRNVPFLFFLLSSFLFGISFLQWFHTVPVFIKTAWGFDEQYIGMLMGTSGILMVLFEMPLVDQIEKRKKILPAILLGIIAMGLSFSPFLGPGWKLLGFVAILFYTTGAIFFFPFNNAIPLYMSPISKKGEYMAWYWMAWSMVGILCPTMGFSFVDVFGWMAFWPLLLVIMGSSFWLTKKLASSFNIPTS